MTHSPIRGVLVPLLTPFDDDMTIATDLYVSHAGRLLEQGCAGLVPFGTTGEALSVGIDERIAAIRATDRCRRRSVADDPRDGALERR